MVTIIRPREKFAFVHIPKCAGTSVQIGLERALLKDRANDEIWNYSALEDHPQLGPVMPAHKPLPMVREYYPHELEAYRRCTCFGVVRDAHARFASAVQQRIREFSKQNINDMTDAEVCRSIDEVITTLAKTDPTLAGVEYVHFTRQSDYVYLDGERIVEKIYPMENLEGMARDMSAHLGRTMHFSEKVNTSRAPQSPLLTMVRKVGSKARPLLPAKLYQSLVYRTINALSTKTPQDKLKVFGSQEVRDFVTDFYADDLALYAKIKATPAIQSGPA